MTDFTNLPEVATQTLPGRMMLEELFAGDDHKDLRQEIIKTGKFAPRHSTKELRIQTRELEDGRHEIMALAA